MQENNNSMENEIIDTEIPREITPLLKKTETESRLQQLQKQIIDALHALQARYQGTKIECKKIGEKILSIKIKKPSIFRPIEKPVRIFDDYKMER